MKRRRSLFIFLTVIPVLAFVLSYSGCTSSRPEKIKMTVLVADSLILPFQAIEEKFEKLNPDIDILSEGHGSIQVIRTITEIGKPADAALVADYQLIPLLMYSTHMPDSEDAYAEWYINFATNSLGIAYTPSSRYADEINTGNWYDIMSRPEVKIGLSDPLIDSLAYRSLMAVLMAEEYYRDDAIFERFFEHAFKLPLEVETNGDQYIIHLPEALRPETERVVMRSYNLQVLSLLESGNVDYAFEYHSVARQHGLEFLDLPDQINLGSPAFSEQYGRVRVKMDFQRFASVQPEFRGALITYAATIPANAPHPAEAISYLSFVFSREGQEVLTNYYQPPIIPEADNVERVPNQLVLYVK
ncbi:MAG: tungstate ABC transporter substrate-binding protein WtpA [Dehalococcoidales bacterium]|nr:tungstate ABC transporter substrate-binding protein WtpA [Dehalococcoidales bacterium]